MSDKNDGSPARSHDYHPEYVEAVEKIGQLEAKLAARSVEATEAIIADAVERCNPTSDGERYCLYNIIKGAVQKVAALTGSLPSEDKNKE